MCKIRIYPSGRCELARAGDVDCDSYGVKMVAFDELDEWLGLPILLV
jgi:hypothetical protein